jgi:aminotransferase
VLAITDEIYEHIVYDGHEHVPMAAIDGMADRTITINGLSKTFSVTGWRIGWAISPPALTGAIRKMHDFLTVGAPAPCRRPAPRRCRCRAAITGARRAIPAAA